MTNRMTVLEEGKADQVDALESLRATLESAGFTTGLNPLAARENDCRWYAWRRLPDAADCECNEKPPSLIVTPHRYTIRDRQYISAEVAITGQRGKWFQLKAYSVNPEELPEKLASIQGALVSAWNAIASFDSFQKDQP